MSKHSSLVWKLLASVAVLGAVAFPACTTSDSGDDAAGGTGSAAGGTGSTAGGVGNSSGGAGSTNTAVTNGGAGNSGGSGSTAAGNPCGTVSTALITDFNWVTTSTDTAVVSFGDWTSNLSGSEFTWANADSTITSDMQGNDWHLSGHMANYAGFNMLFMANEKACNLIDASAYSGISFKIWGTSGGTIKMIVPTASNDITDAWLTASGETIPVPTYGACTPTIAAAPNAKYAQSDCSSPTATITLEAAATTALTAQTVTLTWADFKGGKPNASPNPAEVTGILWNLQWEYAWSTEGGGDPTAHAYDYDFHIDDLTFIAK